MESIWTDLNMGLVFFGLGIGFSTLQDTMKTQNKFSKRIFENPLYSKILLIVLAFQIVVFILLGMSGMFLSQNQPVKELSFGLLSLGVGMIGMLKSALEMAENHRRIQ
jgi:polyferredoxin